MSVYEFANGSYTLPTREWPAFRTRFIEAINDYHTDIKQRAERFTKAHNALKKADRFRNLGRQNPRCTTYYEYTRCGRWTTPVHDAIIFDQHTGKAKINKDAVRRYPTSKDLTIEIDCTDISLTNKTRSVQVDVEYNNKSFQSFLEHPISELLESALEAVKWTRGSGGCIYHRNEYCEHEASSAVWEFGPKKKATSMRR